MTSVLLFELPRGKWTQGEQSWKFQAIKGVLEMKNPWGLDQTEKKPPFRDMDIFWNHILNASKCFIVQGLIQKRNQRQLFYLSSVLLIKNIFAY